MRKLFYIIFMTLMLLMGCKKNNDLLKYADIVNDIDNEETGNINEDSAKDTIIVHITGEVRRRGVYTVEKGSRVIDLIKIAGGFTEDANQDVVNQAETLVDGKKIHIPSKNEQVSQSIHADSKKIIDINNATEEELKMLPNIGEKTAAAIIQCREEKQFETFEDLLKVNGLGKKKLEALKGLISLGGEIYE